MKKEMFILRGVPGCGKSTVAESLGGVICCADDFFMVDGQYQFDAQLLGQAHKQCFDKCEEALKQNSERVVVANTNVRIEDVETYRNLGNQYGYTVFVLIVENWHGGKNTHNVPDDKITYMNYALKQTTKFM